VGTKVAGVPKHMMSRVAETRAHVQKRSRVTEMVLTIVTIGLVFWLQQGQLLFDTAWLTILAGLWLARGRPAPFDGMA
jgi:hypothetical protein